LSVNSDLDDLDGRLIDELSSIVSTAAAAILAARQGLLTATAKPDRSPVTVADHASETIILDGLARLLPGIPVVSEEACVSAPPARLAGEFILVDPLDGTRELVAGRDEFTINLAVAVGGVPRLGIIAAPAQGLIWRGRGSDGAERFRLAPGAPASAGRERARLHTRACPHSGLIAFLSRSHLDPQTAALIERLPTAERIAFGSALKFCRLAEGSGDLYPRLSTTCEWDVAAGHAIVVAAGGLVTDPSGESLTYGHLERDLRVPAFLAWGDPRAPAMFGLL
jgi:3'(2'), 5'-bisphosphate nucleotidase